MEATVRIAVPTESGEGLAAVRSAHFGHAAGFAIVDVRRGEVTPVASVVNPPHAHGGCMSIVSMLASHGVQVVSAVGMGRGPLVGLLDAGIAVHHDASSRTVGEAVTAVVEGRTMPFGSDNACQGHHH